MSVHWCLNMPRSMQAVSGRMRRNLVASRSACVPGDVHVSVPGSVLEVSVSVSIRASEYMWHCCVCGHICVMSTAVWTCCVSAEWRHSPYTRRSSRRQRRRRGAEPTAEQRRRLVLPTLLFLLGLLLGPGVCRREQEVSALARVPGAAESSHFVGNRQLRLILKLVSTYSKKKNNFFCKLKC